MSVEYLDLADFIAISAAITGLDEDTVAKVADLGLADSALHAPAAAFGDREFLEAEETVLAIAAGELDEERTAA